MFCVNVMVLTTNNTTVTVITMTAHTGPDELLTPAAAARICGVTTQTLVYWNKNGKLPAITTLGGYRRYRRSDIESIIRNPQ